LLLGIQLDFLSWLYYNTNHMKSQGKPKILIILGILCLFIVLVVITLDKINLSKKVIPSKLRLGYIKAMAELPVYISLEKNYFRDQDLDVELVPLGYKEEVDALIRGDIDIIPATSLTLPFGIEAQSPNKVKIFHLGGINDNDNEVVEGILVFENSPIIKIEDLKGKKVGVPEGSVDYFVMKTVLTKLDLEPEKNKIQILQMNKNVLPQAFISKQVDAVYLTQPQLAVVKRQTSARYLIVNPRAKHVLNPFWSGGGVVRTNYFENKERKQLFAKYLKAIDTAIDYMRNNPQESKGFLSKYANLEEDLTKEMGNYFKIKTNEKIDFDSLQKVADIYKDVGILNNKIDVSNLVLR